MKRKKKLIIIIGAIIGVVAIVLPVSILTLPKAELDYQYAQSLYKKDNVTSPPDVRASLVLTNGVSVFDPLYNEEVVKVDYATTTTFSVTLEEAGNYHLVLELFVRGNGLNDNSYSLSVNDTQIAEQVNVDTTWINEVEPFNVDLNGNDVMPMQVKSGMYEWQYARDFLNRVSRPLAIPFNAGTNTIDISMGAGNIYIAQGAVVSIEPIISYEQYFTKHTGPSIDLEPRYYEAEYPTLKNDNSINYQVSKDVNVSPYATRELKLNTVLLSRADNLQTLTYRIEAPSDGFYALGFNYHNAVPNKTTFFRIMIDGEVPFGELYHYPLYANSEFSAHRLGDSFGSEPYQFYLTSGNHDFSISTDGIVFNPICEGLAQISESISSLYLQLRTLSVQEGDTNREWVPEEDFPGLVALLTSYSQELQSLFDLAQVYNGSSFTNQGSSYIQSAYQTLNSLLKKPQYLPNNNATLAEGSGSISQNISAASLYYSDASVSFDKIFLAGISDKKVYQKKSGFYAFWESIRRFFISFGSTATYQEDDALEVWVNRPTMYVDLMQDLADSTFTQETGIKVNFRRLADEGKIILSSAAGASPDAVFGLSNWLPYELGIRGLTYNLRQFDDYNTVIKSFAPGALIPLVADNIGLGLPETQDFYVTFYRTDIASSLGFSIPNSWEEIIDLLPNLQRKGMNYYIPLSSSVAAKSLMTTAPFIQQMGGNLFRYESDGTIVTALDESTGINSVKLMTDLYLLYGIPLQVNNFFESFRNGSLPIGVSTVETYLKLQYAAPELKGKWDIALAPGMKNSSDEIVRHYAGSASSCIIMDNEERTTPSWELLKWWLSDTIQTEFSNNLRKMYGAEYIYNSANLQAFQNSTLPEAHKAIVLEQWEYLKEYPRVPGWYMLERELSNTWNDVVLRGANVRTSLDEAVVIINREIRRKLVEFGYISKAGEVLKPYVIADIDDIKEWQQAG